MPWARHDTAFTTAFDDVVVWGAVRSNKNTTAERYQVSRRAVNGICERVLVEAVGRFDLLEGLVAIAIDEVKSNKGHKYLTVVSDHLGGQRCDQGVCGWRPRS